MRARTFLCRSDLERGRMLDMDRRLQRVYLPVIAIFVIASFVSIGTFGWSPFIALGGGAVAFFLTPNRLRHLRRPEYLMVTNWLALELLVALAIVLASGPRVYMLSLLAFPMMVASVVFSGRVVVLQTAIAAGLMLGVGFGFAAEPIHHNPMVLIFPMQTLICTALWASATRTADIDSRDTAVIDPLTGLLNRSALAPRVAELAHQAAPAGQQVSVIVGDVDHFKRINDERGHAEGDVVLREVAYRLGKCMGPFEPVYRLGGEEFAVVLAGIGPDEAEKVAERMRRAIRDAPISDLPVTMSFGVAASHRGERFDYENVLGQADEALYLAKEEGRDRVRVMEGAASTITPRQPLLSEDQPPEPIAETANLARHATRSVLDPDQRGNWLVSDEIEREHMLDMDKRIDRIGHVGNAVLISSVPFAVPFYGWWPTVVGVSCSYLLQLSEDHMRRFRRPEYVLAIGWLIAAIGAAASVVVAAIPPISALSIPALLVVGFSAVFPGRVVIVGGVILGSLVTAAALIVAPHAIANQPGLLMGPLALLGGFALVGSVVGESAFEHRSASIVDPLTGMLNRTALAARAAEVSHQATLSGQPVALLVGDLDRFKRVNDSHGHQVGDQVLREVGYRLRENLRLFESAYRFGGEEFVILLPGRSAVQATEIATRLSDAVRREPISGIPVTISFGVAVSSSGQPCAFDQLFARADQALYDAKQGGRDRVGVLGDEPGPALATA